MDSLNKTHEQQPPGAEDLLQRDLECSLQSARNMVDVMNMVQDAIFGNRTNQGIVILMPEKK